MAENFAAPVSRRYGPLAAIRRAVDHYGIREVICGVSGGVDSVVTLDLCVKHFSTVRCYYMYYVEGLSFQERYLGYLERRYGVAIDRVPHWELSHCFRNADLRHPTATAAAVPRLRPPDFDAWIRRRFELHWIAEGVKYSDSIERNAMISRSDCGVEVKRGRVWPVAHWRHAQISSYLAANHVMMPPDYRIRKNFDGARGTSICWLGRLDVAVAIAEEYPEDFAKICRVFPLIGVQVQRYYQMRDKGKLGGKRHGAKGKGAISS
jgi:phosphoadenosine phosphosulfate reductase